jgi:hypothetical protein
MFGVYIYNYSETYFRSPCSRSVPAWGIRTFQYQNFLITLHYSTLWHVFCYKNFLPKKHEYFTAQPIFHPLDMH